MADEPRVTCETPAPGKQPTSIARWKYDLVRKAILKALPQRGEGLLFKDLPAAVAQQLSDEQRKDLGSIGWYTTTVKLDLEVKNEIYRIEGAKPQRLLRR